MGVNLESLLIVTLNILTAIVAAAVMLIVIWQAPTRRTNQALAVMMLCVTFYSLLNGFSRFLDVSGLPVRPYWYLLLTFYALILETAFIFTLVFTQYTKARWARIVLIVIIASGLIGYVLLQAGLVIRNVQPLGNGAFQTVYGPLAWFALITPFSAICGALFAAAHSTTQYGRTLLPAWLFLAFGVSSSFLGLTLGPIPINSPSLLIATIILGRAVLKEQLFSPLVTLNVQLTQKNRELDEIGRLKSVFLMNFGDDMRSPLNTILGYAAMLQDDAYGPLTEKQHDRLSKVQNNTEHLSNLISDLLDMNQITSGTLTLYRTRIPVKQLLDSVVAIAGPQAVEKGLALHLDETPDLPQLNVDEVRVRQILLNLLSNALKFTAQGSITVRAKPATNYLVRFEIEDTGIGIASDQYEAIFEEFHQIDASATRAYPGSGLGLAITKRLVEMHGGMIGVKSQIGVGSTFYVELPSVETKIPQNGHVAQIVSNPSVK